MTTTAALPASLRISGPVPPAGHVPVRSCDATPHLLRSWGFAVAGHAISHDADRKGPEFGVVRAAARRLGWLVDSHHTPAERDARLAAFHERVAGQSANVAPLLDWFRSEGRLVGHS